MAYNNIISRTDAEALIPIPVAEQIIQGVTEKSVAMTRFRQVSMATGQTRLPVLSALPVAYFVNGDTGLKQTSEINWKNKYLTAEEIAVIVPIPENVLDDSAFDVWGESRPLIEEAVGRALDAAVFFGVNKPSSWPSAVVPAAVAAGNVIARGTNTQANGGIAGDISDTLATVENDGFDPNLILTTRGFRGRLRNTRATTGEPLVNTTGEIYDVPVEYVMSGQWPDGVSAAELIAMDANEFVLGIRKDFTYKILTEAVIQDETGAIIYNLAQQDMVAMRLVFRAAYQVSNRVTTSQAVEANRFPAGVLRSPAV